MIACQNKQDGTDKKKGGKGKEKTKGGGETRDRDFLYLVSSDREKLRWQKMRLRWQKRRFWSQVAEIAVLVRAVADSPLRSRNKKKQWRTSLIHHW